MNKLFFVILLVLPATPIPLAAQSPWPDPAAASVFDSLLQLADGLPEDSAAARSLALHRAGLLAGRNDLPGRAIEATRRALDIRLANEATLADGVLLSAFNLGTYHAARKEYRKALDYFALVQGRAPNRKEGVAWFQSGRAYGSTGAFPAAESAFLKALELAPFNDGDYYSAYVRQQIGLMHLGKFNAEGGTAALPYLRTALAFFADQEYDYEEMETRNLLGWALTETGDYPAAITELERAEQLAVAREIDDEDLTAILTNLGMAHRRAGRPELARLTYARTLALERRRDEPTEPNLAVAVVLNNLSTVHLAAGAADSALIYAQRALVRAVPGFDPADEAELPALDSRAADQTTLLVFLRDRARAHHALGLAGRPAHYSHALATFRRADELLDLMRRRQLLEDTRTYWRADARGLYEEAIATALAANDPAAAFYFMEKARARLLLDELSAGRAEAELPAPARKRLTELARQTRLSEDDLAIRQRFTRFQDSLYAAFPDYAAASVGSPPPPPERVSAILDGRTLVEYFVSAKRTLALVWPPDGPPRLVELAAPERWQPALNDYRAALTQPAAELSPDAPLALYQQLIAPLQLPPGARLIIVPDDELYLLPFGALLAETPAADMAHRDWPWLAEKYDLHYAFSTQLLDLARRQRGRGNGRVLALAPVARLGLDDGVDQRLELPATLRTLRHLAARFPTDTLVNAAADRAAFRERADAYSVLHLGTHAYLEEGGSFLLRDQASPRYTVKDLNAHRLTADLVVIGACETGLGERLYGEGIASLARGFARRGAPALLLSLWSVNDAATADLLNHTYDGLADDLGPAGALNAAGGRYRSEVTNPAFGHPYYWAGVVYYGPDAGLELAENGLGWWVWGVAALVLIAVLWLVLKSRWNG